MDRVGEHNGQSLRRRRVIADLRRRLENYGDVGGVEQLDGVVAVLTSVPGSLSHHSLKANLQVKIAGEL